MRPSRFLGLGALLLLTTLLLLLLLLPGFGEAHPTEAVNAEETDAAELQPGPPKIQKFYIPFRENKSVQKGSFINVPTRCPSNMLKVGPRCRVVF